MDNILTGMSLVKGAGASSDEALLLLCIDEFAHTESMPHSVFASYNSGHVRLHGHRPWWCADVVALPGPSSAWVAVGEYGNVTEFVDGRFRQEHISGPDDRGPLRSARLIGNEIYTVGADLQVYRRGARGWEAIGPDSVVRSGREDGTLEAVDGFKNGELYTGGWDGEIWRYRRGYWTLCPTPTDLILTDICCAGDGQVYACGQGGIIVQGRDDEWSVIEIDELQPDLWSICWFQGHVFVASMQGVYRIVTGEVVPTEASSGGWSFYDLSVAGDTLWSIGAKDLLRYDGTSWQRIEDVEIDQP